MTFQEFITKVGQTFNGNPLTMALTIAFLFVLFYFAISILNHNNAKWVIVVFVAYILCTGTMFMLAEISGWNYFIVPLLFIVAIVAMFSTEIKRGIWKVRVKKSGEPRKYDKGQNTLIKANTLTK